MKDMVTLKHMREQIELVIKAKDKELTSLHKKVKDLEEENGGLRAFAEIHGVTKKIDDEHDKLCEGTMCWCEARRKAKEIENGTDKEA